MPKLSELYGISEALDTPEIESELTWLEDGLALQQKVLRESSYLGKTDRKQFPWKEGRVQQEASLYPETSPIDAIRDCIETGETCTAEQINEMLECK